MINENEADKMEKTLLEFADRDANARLIAAAPTLLAACEAALACVEAEWGADFVPYNLSDENAATANAAVLSLRAAIRKARGEA